MDLDQLETTAADRGVRMPLRHPATDEVLMQEDGVTPITLTLLGQDSKAHKAAASAALDRRLARQAERAGRVAMTTAGIEEDGLNLAVACIAGWDGIRWGGQDQPFSSANAREMFARWPWAREQAETFIARRGNFLPAAAAA